jgi:hypothetical protein
VFKAYQNKQVRVRMIVISSDEEEPFDVFIKSRHKKIKEKTVREL